MRCFRCEYSWHEGGRRERCSETGLKGRVVFSQGKHWLFACYSSYVTHNIIERFVCVRCFRCEYSWHEGGRRERSLVRENTGYLHVIHLSKGSEENSLC